MERPRTLCRVGFLGSAIYVLIVFAAISVLSSASACAGDPSVDGVHLYYFTSKGCAPCEKVKPAIETLANEGFPVTIVDVGERPDWATAFQVRATPTVTLVQGDRIVGVHAGIAKLPMLRSWFAAVGYPNAPERRLSRTASDGPTVLTRPRQTKIVVPMDQPGVADRNFSTPTMLKGTRRPKDQNESRSLLATVRLRVEDPEGTSFATGTVIHTHEGESLVMTCGHVFRESEGTGEITAEFGFEDGVSHKVPGELISYDSDERDIALVVIKNGKFPVTPVVVASASNQVGLGEFVYTLGCDHGELPTIRRTKIKNRATYDGAMKYDIFGRPVDGRSGGGLFNSRGELIGVCNAAAVEVDEGIYTALDTVHWQLRRVSLSHLFDRNQQFDRNTRLASQQSASQSLAAQNSSSSTSRNNLASTQSGLAGAATRSNSGSDAGAWRNVRNAGGIGSGQPVSQIRNVGFEQQVPSSDREVIIQVRSKSNSVPTKTITLSQPTPKLLKYLDKLGDTGGSERQLDVARYRKIKRPTAR